MEVGVMAVGVIIVPHNTEEQKHVEKVVGIAHMIMQTTILPNMAHGQIIMMQQTTEEQ